jgi:hypothetical protein
MPPAAGTRLGTSQVALAVLPAGFNRPTRVPRLRLKDRSWTVNSPSEEEQ